MAHNRGIARPEGHRPTSVIVMGVNVGADAIATIIAAFIGAIATIFAAWMTVRQSESGKSDERISNSSGPIESGILTQTTAHQPLNATASRSLKPPPPKYGSLEYYGLFLAVFVLSAEGALMTIWGTVAAYQGGYFERGMPMFLIGVLLFWLAQTVYQFIPPPSSD